MRRWWQRRRWWLGGVLALGAAVAWWCWPAARGGVATETMTIPDLGLTLVRLKAGTFQMGEAPGHQVTLTHDFWMGRTEVTRGQFAAFVAATKCVTTAEQDASASIWRAPGFVQTDEHPVVCVSWDDAVAFCAWLTTREGAAGRLPAGLVYRLPTEAEWEYACRAGTTTKYAWGDNWRDGRGWGNFAPRCTARRFPGQAWLEREGPSWLWRRFPWLLYYDDGYAQTAPVGRFRANAWGLYDVHGNVWEWCADWDGAHGREVQKDPKGPKTGSCRVSRGRSWYFAGGSWGFDASSCRRTTHDDDDASGAGDGRSGFRVVCGVR